MRKHEVTDCPYFDANPVHGGGGAYEGRAAHRFVSALPPTPPTLHRRSQLKRSVLRALTLLW